MKRIFGIIFVLIVLAAFTPLWGSASEAATDLTCSYLNDKSGVLDAGEYKLTGYTCTYNGDITLITGKITLDLNGKTLSANSVKCPDYTSQCSLEIKGSGTLTVNDSIRVNNDLTIRGGEVTAYGNDRAIVVGYDFTISGGTVTAPNHGIGVVHKFTILDGRVNAGISSSDTINIEGGTVEATNYGKFSSSISARNNITISGEDTQVTATAKGEQVSAVIICTEGSVIIRGGTVTATGDDSFGHGISADSGSITISGGTVTASGGVTAIRAKENITIENGGTVTKASGDTYGISARDITIKDGGTVTEASGTSHTGIYAGGDITIESGGTVNASGGQYGIFSGEGSITISGTVEKATGTKLYGIYARDGITIEKDGTVEASGGTHGIYADLRDINIRGTVTEATGTNDTGIYAYIGNITIRGTVENATGGQYGIHTESGSITIESGSTVNATGTDRPGIYAESGSITISGENTKVTAESNGIDGTGIYAKSGPITISGGTVTAKATGTEGSGIYAQSGLITISGGTVESTGGIYGIYAESGIISISGMVEASGGTYGIHASGGTTISGENTQVTAEATGTYGTGIDADNSITISGGTVESTGSQYGIHAGDGDIIISGGTVKKASGTSDSGIYARGQIIISDVGTVEEASSDHIGIYADGGITVGPYGTVTAAGETQAVSGIVKNAVPGIGWTDSAGTQGKELIKLPDVPESGQSLTSYKQVRFPASTAVVTFTVFNGAWNDGARGEKTETLYCAQGDDLKLAQNQIPTVGSNPDSGFITGSWNETPGTERVFTENTTFTYTYAEKTTAVVDPSPADPGLTYTGQEQALVTAGKASGGTMQYALGEESSAPETGWSSSIPTGTGAGTYFVWYKVAGDQSHSDSPAGGPVKVVIAQKPVTVTAENKSKKPGEPDPELTAVVNGLIGNDTVTYTLSREEGDEPGTYAVTAAGEASQGNYSVSFVNGTFTISEKELRTFTIRYDANGGTGTMAEQTVTEGTAAALTANSFTREHHTFTGWNTKADGSGTAYADQASVTLSADLELFAQWKEADKIIDTDQPALTEVPKELQKKYTSVSALQNALIFELKVNGEPARIEQTVFVDVVLKVSFDGGEHWEIATPDNFPAGGMEVRLDYPEGTGKDTHQFSVSHMFTVGEKAGQMEYPKVDAKDDGLYVWLTGLSPVAIAWREIETPKETMKVPVEIDSVLKNSGSRGLPDEIREMEVTLTVTLKDGDTEVKTTEPLKLKLTKDAVTPMQDAEFEKVLEGLAPGKQPVTVSVSPKTVFGRDKIYSSEGPVEGPVKWKYELSAKGELNVKDGKIIVRIYLFWDNGSRPEEVRVVALPEDEIGAYKLRDDGTKEYLLFQTYDICMAWLGSDELCRGPERCYHK